MIKLIYFILDEFNLVEGCRNMPNAIENPRAWLTGYITTPAGIFPQVEVYRSERTYVYLATREYCKLEIQWISPSKLSIKKK